MARPLPSLTTTLRTSETLIVAAVGGLLFMSVGFPAGLISGSLIAVGIAGLLGRPMQVPRQLTRIIMVLVGISLGGVVTPETLRGVATFPLSIAILAVAVTAMTLATMTYLRWVHGWDAQSALFGASPGALAQVMVLAAEYGADMRKIVIVQVMRVVVLTIGIPAGLAFFGLSASGAMVPGASSIDTTVAEIAILVAFSTATAFGLLRTGFPGGLMFGAMLGSAILHGTGWIQGSLPWWVVAAAVIGIGSVTGSRFAGTDARTLLQYLWAALGSFAVAIAVASSFVMLLTFFVSVPIADVVVAFAPGAQDTMMVLALSMHLDPIFVGAHHLARYVLVSMSIPILARWLARDNQPPSPKAPQRPTIED